jgi:Fe-S-cluster containining protein
MDATKALLAAYDGIADASPHKSKWACAASCSYCCHMPVHLTAIEALAVAQHAVDTFDETAREHAAQRLASTAASIAEMDEHAFKNSRTPCALLGKDGTCTVYAARPLACRGFHSTSVDVCKASFESNDTPADGARDRKTEDVCARMVVALHAVSRAGGLADVRFELNSAVARLLPPGADAIPIDVTGALEGARGKPSPLDVPLARIIGRFRYA